MVEAIAYAALMTMVLGVCFLVGLALCAVGLVLLPRRKKGARRLPVVLIVLGAVLFIPPAYLKISTEISWALEQKRTREDDGPLITAVKAYDAKKVRELLASGADTEYENSLHETALNVACSKQMYNSGEISAMKEIVRLLVDHGADIYHNSGEKANENGFLYSVLPPLSESIEYGNGTLVPLLLELGADPDFDSVRGRPLYLAVAKQDCDSVKALLAAGANPLIDGDGSDLLFACLENFHLSSYEGGNSHARGRFPEMLSVLLDAGCNPNARKNLYMRGYSNPLHIVCAEGSDYIWGSRPAAVRLLVEHGAKPNVKDEDGKTPLDYAREVRDHYADYEEAAAEYEEIAALLSGR